MSHNEKVNNEASRNKCIEKVRKNRLNLLSDFIRQYSVEADSAIVDPGDSRSIDADVRVGPSLWKIDFIAQLELYLVVCWGEFGIYPHLCIGLDEEFKAFVGET